MHPPPPKKKKKGSGIFNRVRDFCLNWEVCFVCDLWLHNYIYIFVFIYICKTYLQDFIQYFSLIKKKYNPSSTVFHRCDLCEDTEE